MRVTGKYGGIYDMDRHIWDKHSLWNLYYSMISTNLTGLGFSIIIHVNICSYIHQSGRHRNDSKYVRYDRWRSDRAR